MSAAPTLEVRDLHVQLRTESACIAPVAGVSLILPAGETLGLVGESGSGKSMLSLALMGLLPAAARRLQGEILLEQTHALHTLGARAMRRLRGRRLAMVFQDPMTALNPSLSIGLQLAEVLEVHLGASRRAAWASACDMLVRVGIPDATGRMHEAPHTFSGGQRQRILIAMALLCRPALLIADEPTTALDVTVQAEILALIAELQADLGMAVLLISHDLRVVAQAAQQVAVMYAGRIVELGPAADIWQRAAHPYTQGLLRAAPDLAAPRIARWLPIPGRPPDLAALPPGCAFAPRCPRASTRCAQAQPPLLPLGSSQSVACWHPGPDSAGALT